MIILHIKLMDLTREISINAFYYLSLSLFFSLNSRGRNHTAQVDRLPSLPYSASDWLASWRPTHIVTQETSGFGGV